MRREDEDKDGELPETVTDVLEKCPSVNGTVREITTAPEAATAGNHIMWRVGVFAAFSVALAVVFRHCLADLWQLSRTDETYSHMPLIPLVSAYLLFAGRKRIAEAAGNAFLPGLIVIAVGALLLLAGPRFFGTAIHKDNLSLSTLTGLMIWLGGFITLFGLRSFRQAAFPLLFLLFLVPIPTVLLRWIVHLLQRASTEIAHGLFLLIGVPFVRNDFVFELPGMSVMVAEQCSGIRSSISLLITGILAAHLGLNSTWRRGVLILSVLPITVFKNALRVLTLSLLGAYVDPRIMSSSLHRAGGIPFFMLALLIFGCVFWLLRRSEVRALPEGHR